MSSAPLRDIERLFQTAVELPPEQRRAWLDEQCGDDAALRSVLQSLLEQHEARTIPLLKSVDQTHVCNEVLLDGRVGPYRLLKVLGEGGCGTVFLARQDAPIRRDVALKLIKLGMDTRQVIARFEAERHTLALMDHPNVARVLDAGATDAGRPYFVMEYVPGAAITGYCDTRRLGTTERLRLFIQVCEAVQHAHQKGVIHRDIKPSNVLVEEIDGKAIPKVIDFGIAKAMGEHPGRRTLQTEQGQLLGTPAYMSPEQADPSGGDIDTRSDVYSLGVLLYELLSGSYPFGDDVLREARFDDLRQMILTVEPPKPSTRIRTLGQDSAIVARRRGVDQRSLIKRLRGDLDWITLKAMDKDRTRRYATVQELVADVIRHLNHEPVQARAPSRMYRARKFVRRNRAAVTGAALVTLALMGGLIGTTLGMARARRSELAAQRQAYKASLAAAQAGIQTNDGSLVWRSLSAAPEPLRGWEWHYLKRLAGGSQASLRLPLVDMCAAALSGDGRTLASAVRDGTISIWNLCEGRVIRRAHVDMGESRLMALSHDGRLLAAAGPGGTTMISTESGAELWHDDGHTSFRFCRDDAAIALGSVTGTDITLVEAETGRVLRTYVVRAGTVLRPELTPDRRHVVFGDGHGWVVALDADTGDELWRHRGTAWCLTSEATHAVLWEAGSPDCRLHDIQTGREAGLIPGWGGVSLDSLAGPHGGLFAVREYALTLLDQQFAPRTTLLCPSSMVVLRALPTTGELVAVCRGGEIVRWDPAISQAPFVVGPYADGVGGASISLDGRVIATSGWGQLTTWDAQTGRQRWTRYITRTGIRVAANTDGTVIAAAVDDGGLHLLDGRDGRTIQTIRLSSGAAAALLWVPGSHDLMVGGADGALWIVRFEQVGEATIHELGRTNGPADKLAIDADGRTAAVAVSNGQIQLVDVRTGAVRDLAAAEAHGTRPMAFGADGSSLFTVWSNRTVARWDIATGRRMAVYEGSDTDIFALCAHPDGSCLAAGCSGAIHIWDISTAQELLTIRGPDSPRALAFSSDGRTLLTSGGEAAVMAHETAPPACGYAARQKSLRVRQIADAVQRERVSDEAVAVLRADVALPADLRDAAIELVTGRGDHPNTCNSLAWWIAIDPRRPVENYGLGVRYVRAAMKTWPDDPGFLNTLALLQCRLEEYTEALQTLAQSDEASRRVRGRSHPSDTAVLAMVKHHLGRAEEARIALTQTRELMRDPKNAEDADNQKLLNQAAALVESP